MIISILYNYRTSTDGTKYFDSMTVGEESTIFVDETVVIEKIEMDWNNFGADVFAYSMDAQGQRFQDYLIHQRHIHQVIQSI